MEAGKPLAVLAYVALAPGGRVSRDHVAELMWPGTDLTEARHSLRQSLYRLRHAASAPLIELRGTDLSLAAAVRLDCLETERLAADGDLARAHGLLRGNFLEGFAIPQSHEFESWAESEQLPTIALAKERMVVAGAGRSEPDIEDRSETVRSGLDFYRRVPRQHQAMTRYYGSTPIARAARGGTAGVEASACLRPFRPPD